MKDFNAQTDTRRMGGFELAREAAMLAPRPRLIRIVERGITGSEGDRYSRYGWEEVYNPFEGYRSVGPKKLRTFGLARGGPSKPDEGGAATGGTWPAIEVSGRDDVPTDGSVVVYAVPSESGDMMLFSWQAPRFGRVTAKNTDVGGEWFSWEEVILIDGEWEIRPGGLVGEESNGFRKNPLLPLPGGDLEVGQVVIVYSPPTSDKYGMPRAIVQPTGQPNVVDVYVVNSAGGMVTLTIAGIDVSFAVGASVASVNASLSLAFGESGISAVAQEWHAWQAPDWDLWGITLTFGSPAPLITSDKSELWSMAPRFASCCGESGSGSGSGASVPVSGTIVVPVGCAVPVGDYSVQRMQSLTFDGGVLTVSTPTVACITYRCCDDGGSGGGASGSGGDFPLLTCGDRQIPGRLFVDVIVGGELRATVEMIGTQGSGGAATWLWNEPTVLDGVPVCTNSNSSAGAPSYIVGLNAECGWLLSYPEGYSGEGEALAIGTWNPFSGVGAFSISADLPWWVEVAQNSGTSVDMTLSVDVDCTADGVYETPLVLRVYSA